MRLILASLALALCAASGFAAPPKSEPVTRAPCGCAFCTCWPHTPDRPWVSDTNCGSYLCPANGGKRGVSDSGAKADAGERWVTVCDGTTCRRVKVSDSPVTSYAAPTVSSYSAGSVPGGCCGMRANRGLWFPGKRIIQRLRGR